VKLVDPASQAGIPSGAEDEHSEAAYGGEAEQQESA